MRLLIRFCIVLIFSTLATSVHAQNNSASGNKELINYKPVLEDPPSPMNPKQAVLRVWNERGHPILVNFQIGWARTKMEVEANGYHSWSVPPTKGKIMISWDGYAPRDFVPIELTGGKINSITVLPDPEVVAGPTEFELPPGFAEIQMLNKTDKKLDIRITGNYWNDQKKPMHLVFDIHARKLDFARMVLMEAFDIAIGDEAKDSPIKVSLYDEDVIDVQGMVEIRVLRRNLFDSNTKETQPDNPCACDTKLYTKNKNSIKTAEYEACINDEGDKNGWAKNYNEINGRLWEEGAYQCNYREGIWTSYYVEDGKSGINFQQAYERGVKVGPRVTANFTNVKSIRNKAGSTSKAGEPSKAELAKRYLDSGIRKTRDLKQHQEAIKDFNKAIELFPRYATAYNSRGLAKRSLNDFNGALADFTKAIDIKAESKFYYNRGMLKITKMNNREGALADFNRAIQLDPKDGRPVYGLGIYYWQTDKTRACQAMEKSCSLGANFACDEHKRLCN